VARHMKTITVDYGYDIHKIEIDDQNYALIIAGKKVEIIGQGFSHEEDGEVQDYWRLNNSPGEIYFYLDDGAEFYAQNSRIDN